MDIPVLVAQEFQQATEEVGQISDKLQVGNGVKEGDPSNKKLPSERVDDPYSLLEQRDETRE